MNNMFDSSARRRLCACPTKRRKKRHSTTSPIYKIMAGEPWARDSLADRYELWPIYWTHLYVVSSKKFPLICWVVFVLRGAENGHSAKSLLIDSARQMKECQNIKIISKLVLGQQQGIFKQKYPEHSLFNRSTYFCRYYTDCLNLKSVHRKVATSSLLFSS
jgi:hypothetical protein